MYLSLSILQSIQTQSNKTVFKQSIISVVTHHLVSILQWTLLIIPILSDITLFHILTLFGFFVLLRVITYILGTVFRVIIHWFVLTFLYTLGLIYKFLSFNLS